MRYLKDAKINDIVMVPAYVAHPERQGHERFKWLPAIVRRLSVTAGGAAAMAVEYVRGERIIERKFVIGTCRRAEFSPLSEMGTLPPEVAAFEKAFHIPRHELLKYTVTKRIREKAQTSLNFSGRPES